MNPRGHYLRRLLVNLDRGALSSLGARLIVALLFFSPWAFRFERSPFRMEDVDPAVLEEAKTRGVDLLDPNVWPTATGIAFKLLAVAGALGLAWWLISRSRRFLNLRFGSGILPLLPVFVGVALLLVGLNSTVPPTWVGISFTTSSVPVASGWVHSPLLEFGTFLTHLTLLVMCGPLILELLLQALESRLQLAEARDGALRARLAPHFLFNTLNTLHAQIEEDPGGAQATTEHLAQLFRQVLEVTERPTVPLKQELAFVEEYLGIEQARLGERLKVSIDVSDEAAEAHIPVLGLHTLVENAIRHGLEPRKEGGELRISAHLQGKRLRVVVQDPGDGTPGKPGAGRALANLRARLARPKDLELTRVANGHCAAFTFPQA